MRNRRNYYRVLHVQRDAPTAVLKSSFRALMLSLEMHPDRGGEHWNAALINQAYAVLSDPVRRAEYDRTIGQPQAGAEGRSATGGAAKDPEGTRHPGNEASGTCCVFCGSGRGAAASAPDKEVCLECGSPMTLAGAPRLEASGRRASRRVARHGRILYYIDWPQPAGIEGQILDMSPGGLSFESRVPAARFQIVKIEGPLLDAVARVVGCRDIPGHSVIGVQFFTVHFHSPRGTFLSTRA